LLASFTTYPFILRMSLVSARTISWSSTSKMTSEPLVLVALRTPAAPVEPLEGVTATAGRKILNDVPRPGSDSQRIAPPL
jgi:hypothetical protein